jgi:hypothetical protein
MAAAAALTLAWLATPVEAYVVEVMTTITVADANDQTALREALQTAVDGVLKDAIAFQPTLVVLTRAMVVGDRLYVRLLIADKEGERTVEELGAKNPDRGEPVARETELKI